MSIGSLDHRVRLGGLLRPDICYERPRQGGPAIFDLVGDLLGKRVLDLGCGLGTYRKEIVKRGGEWIGLDLSGGGCSVIADGNRLPFRADSIDHVLSAAVLEHIPDQDQHLREIHRVLRKDGVVFGYVSFLEPLHGLSYFHVTHLGLEVLLARNGFRAERIFPADIAFPFLIEQLLFPKRVPILQPAVRLLLRAIFALLFAANRIGRGLLTQLRRLPREQRRLEGEQHALILPLRFAVGLNFVARRIDGSTHVGAGYRAMVREG